MGSQDIHERVRDRELDIEAARRLTAPLLKKGWVVVFCGWALGLVPIVGLLGWALAFVGGVAIGGVAMARGNVGGGLVLGITAWIGTMVVGFVEVLVWMALGFGGLGLLGSL